MTAALRHATLARDVVGEDGAMSLLLLFGIVSHVWLWPFVPPDQDPPPPPAAVTSQP